MEQQINKVSIHLALAKAQAGFKKAIKANKVDFDTIKGGKTKYSYADLSDIWDCIGGPLAENNLFVSHQTFKDEKGELIMETLVYNETGEHLSTQMPVIGGETKNPQAFGSALTYTRRYSICSLLGVITDDDDAISGTEEVKKQQQSKPVSKPSDVQNFEKEAKKPEPATDAQKTILTNLINTSDLSEEDKKKSLEWLKTDKATKEKVGDKIAKLAERIDNAKKTASELPA
jgi:hypothetical protein